MYIKHHGAYVCSGRNDHVTSQRCLNSRLSLTTDTFMSTYNGHGAVQAALAWAILTDWGWRWLVALSSLPLLCLLLLYPQLPESPYWLVSAGRTAEAQALLQSIARANGRPLPAGRLQPSATAVKVSTLFCFLQRFSVFGVTSIVSFLGVKMSCQSRRSTARQWCLGQRPTATAGFGAVQCRRLVPGMMV